MFRQIKLSLLVLALLLSLIPISNSQPQPIKSGNISFLPNVIPDLVVSERVGRHNESFRFSWLGNSFDIELFFNSSGKLYSLRDFEDDFGVSVEYVTEREDSLVRFGWLIGDVEAVSVEGAWFKIEDSSFDYDVIELETIEAMPPILNYSITRFHLPDNLVLSFEDLVHKGFVIGWQNKTATSIKGFSGKSSWDLDPITFSSPIITVTGFTEGTPCTFWDVWNASDANGWNVVQMSFTSENVSFDFGARLYVGDAVTTTWFADENVCVVFNSTCVSANSQDLINVRTNAHFRLGKAETVSSKTSSSGVSIVALDNKFSTRMITGEDSTNADVDLYSSRFSAPNYEHLFYRLRNNSPIWNCMFDAVDITDCSVDIYNIFVMNNIYGTSYPSGTFDKMFIMQTTNGLYFYGGTSTTVKNLVLKEYTYAIRCLSMSVNQYIVNAEMDTWSFYWWYSGNTGEVFRQYEFELTVTTPANVPIEDANVTLTYYGNGGGTHGTWLTDANGEIPSQTVTAGFYNQTGADTIYTYNPYEITITKDGYITYQRNFTQLEKKSWNIALLPSTEDDGSAFNSTYFLLGFLMCLPFMLIFGAMYVKRRNQNE